MRIAVRSEIVGTRERAVGACGPSTDARSNRNPSTCISVTQYRKLSRTKVHAQRSRRRVCFRTRNIHVGSCGSSDIK